MAFGKTPEQKTERDEDKRAAEYWASPVGQAYTARSAGAAFFQVEIPIARVGGMGASSSFGSSKGGMKSTGGKPDMLGQIEEVGWHLEHVGYVFVETGATTSNRLVSTGQGTVTKGQVLGIYLFRAR